MFKSFLGYLSRIILGSAGRASHIVKDRDSQIVLTARQRVLGHPAVSGLDKSAEIIPFPRISNGGGDWQSARKTAGGRVSGGRSQSEMIGEKSLL